MTKYKVAKDQINVTLPKEARVIFDWLRNYDPEMTSDAKVAAYLIKLGAEQLLYSSLKDVEPLDEHVCDGFLSSLRREAKPLAELIKGGEVDLFEANKIEAEESFLSTYDTSSLKVDIG